jgi:two-component system, OmpR family, response regulator
MMLTTTTPHVAPHPLRVLCVDDNRDAADSEAEMLGLVGFDTRACYDGTSALRTAEAFHPCIYLIDLNMPGMDGDVLAGRLRETVPGPARFIAVTARSDADTRQRLHAAGFHLHLVKPVAPDALIEVVENQRQYC